MISSEERHTGEILSLGLVVSVLLRQDPSKFSTHFPMNYEIFQLGWWEQALYPALNESKHYYLYYFQIFFCLALGSCITHLLISTLLNPKRQPSPEITLCVTPPSLVLCPANAS